MSRGPLRVLSLFTLSSYISLSLSLALVSSKIQVVAGPAPSLSPGQFSESFNDFVSKCLSKKVDERASYSQLLEHNFIEMNKENDISAFFQEILNLIN